MRLLRNSGRPERICGMNLFPVYPIKRTDNPPPFQSLSSVPLNYVEQKFDRMRGILIYSLIKVHYKFEQMDDTSDGLQLVGATLPCKYQQVFASVLEDLILISDKSYCRK
ncbi:hypothetical protein ABFX02_14G283000 [Erythranthe guttata]